MSLVLTEVTVYQRGDKAPTLDEHIALLTADGRLFTRPSIGNEDGRVWCHYTSGRVTFDQMPFPLVSVALPDFAEAVSRG